MADRVAAGRVLASRALAGRAAAAIDAARAAAPAWSAGGYARAAALHGAAAGVADRLGPDAAEQWTWFAGWADKIAAHLGAAACGPAGAVRAAMLTPRGVAGVVAGPAASADLVPLVAAPLAAGCPVVLAAGPDDSHATALAQALAAAGLPTGVLAVLHGPPAELPHALAGVDVVYPALMAHQDAHPAGLELLARALEPRELYWPGA